MGINIDNLYVASVQKEVVSSGGIETHIEPPSYDAGDTKSIDVCVSAESVETCVQSQETTYEALSGNGATTIVGLEECKDTVISAATSNL